MHYPLQRDFNPPKPQWFRWPLIWYDTIRITRRERRKSYDVTLIQLNQWRAISADDLPLVFITHNDIALLPSFLSHYRKLGVTRFICVDDISSDGSREFLQEQADVDLWISPLRYAQARRGRLWREQLFAKYGKNRWYINVDSDEFLFYFGCSHRSISELIDALERSNEKRLAAPMIDMYSDKNEKVRPVADEMPWRFSRYFDLSGYRISLSKRGVRLMGGPRGRKFGEKNELIKYPLLYWDDKCFFGSSPHRPLPFYRNFPSTWGVLLHFKFFVNYREKIAEAVSEGQHYDSSVHYRNMMNEIDRLGEIDLKDTMSMEFRDADQLADLGFLTKISWTN